MQTQNTSSKKILVIIIVAGVIVIGSIVGVVVWFNLTSRSSGLTQVQGFNPPPTVEQPRNQMPRMGEVLDLEAAKTASRFYEEDGVTWGTAFDFLSTTWLTDEFLSQYPRKEDLIYWISSIFARHGHVFHKQRSLDYFQNCNWYNGYRTYNNIDNPNQYSEIERYNYHLLQDYYFGRKH